MRDLLQETLDRLSAGKRPVLARGAKRIKTKFEKTKVFRTKKPKKKENP